MAKDVTNFPSPEHDERKMIGINAASMSRGMVSSLSVVFPQPLAITPDTPNRLTISSTNTMVTADDQGEYASDQSHKHREK